MVNTFTGHEHDAHILVTHEQGFTSGSALATRLFISLTACRVPPSDYFEAASA